MSASFVELSLEGGLPEFRCPVTGVPVFDTEEGFVPQREQSPYLRFFIDWVAETWVAPSAALPQEARPAHEKVLELLESDIEGSLTMIDLIRQCADAMPSSAVIFELLDPPRGGGHDGSVCYVAFDFAAVHEDPAPMRLVSVND